MSLLDLSFGSALAIAIDCSGSMGNEIEAVKEQVLEIIAEASSGGAKPSVYILAAYGGQFGPNVDLTVTQDEEEFKAKVETLIASGGDEVVFQALQVQEIMS